MAELEQVMSTAKVKIHVMAVDDDDASLAMLSHLLTTLKYEVTSCNDPIRALHTLRTRKQSFDLIITDLYMPNMDGFELTKRVEDEFKLPIIMISADDRESVMFRAIQEGVVLYLLKPITLNDLRNIWQFAISRKLRTKINPNSSIGSHGTEFRALKVFDEDAISVSSTNERRKDSKKGNNKRGSATAIRRAKVVWTDFLQYRFLEAVHYIGLQKAVPKKILEVMNVPGLTRENVASHLQKYRIFLRKIEERCLKVSDKTTEEALWATFISRHSSHENEAFRSHLHQKGTLRFRPGPESRHFSPSQNPNSQFSRHGIGNYDPPCLGHNTSLTGIANPMQMNENREIEATDSSDSQFQELGFFGDSYSSQNYVGMSIPDSNVYEQWIRDGNLNSLENDEGGLGIAGENSGDWDSIQGEGVDFGNGFEADKFNGDLRDSSHALMDMNNQQQGSTGDFIIECSNQQLCNIY